MDHQFTKKYHGHYTFFSTEQYLDFSYLWNCSLENYKNILFWVSKECASKWEQKCGIWIHSWCVHLRSSVRFSVLFCLSALYTEAKNDMYKRSVHILLLSSWGNDCNQSDFLCSGKTKKLHAERYSHVISVMQWAMTDNWMACLCVRLTC